MICCICGKDMTGQPVMKDRMSGAVYCYEDREYFYSIQDPASLSACPRCGFRYSATWSTFLHSSAPACPACGAELKR